MDPDTFRYLIEEFNRIQFFDLKDQYRSRRVDNQIVTTPYGSPEQTLGCVREGRRR